MQHRYDDYAFRHGFGQQMIAGPLKVYQGERFVGTVPGFPVASTSGIFDVRPTDFTPTVRDGEQVLEAHRSIGPGDFTCIAGFRAATGEAPQKSEMAQTFDALASVAGRSGAMKATIDEALSDTDRNAKR